MVQLFPVPRRVELAGPRGDLRVTGTAVDPHLPSQGYRVRITPDGTTIDHADELGLRYATDTLAQLGPAPPGSGVVEDHPTFTERGFMLDVSRDRVPTEATLDWLVDLLGRLRFTELQLYTEHTFAWPGHEEVWRDASPLTAAELRRLAARCRAAGLRLVPCLNTFGHMERFLRHDTHRHRAECPDGAPALVGDGVGPPTTLAPTPANAEFALDLVRGVLEAVPSSRVHVGGDEPFELGLGRSAADVAARGRATVYTEHLGRIVGPLIEDGHEVLFWGDVLARAPEQAAALPVGATAVAWWYLPPVPDPPPLSRVLGRQLAERLGLPEDALAGFVAHTGAFADTGRPFWVAPGTSSWNSLVGRWPDAAANIDDAVAVGQTRGARGVLLTDWGDNGHHQPLATSLPAAVHAAGAAWNPATHDRALVPTVVDRLLGADGLGDGLVAVASVESALGVRQFNGGAMHAALLGMLRVPRRHDLDQTTVRAALEHLADPLPGVSSGGERVAILTEEVQAAARLAGIGLRRLARACGVDPPDDPEPDLGAALDQQRAAWLRSSRPGGLPDSLDRIPSS